MKGERCAAALACGAMAVIAVGCAGLPRKPTAPQLTTRAPLEGFEFTGGGAWPAADWWKEYHDPTLDQLIVLALGSSPTLATAHARFDSARESVRVAGAASGVHVDLNADIDRQRLSDNGLIPPQLLGFTWYNQSDLGLQATYTFDWWGKQRDAVQAAVDEAHASQADRSAAALMLASSIADTYYGWQADENRLLIAREREVTVQREGRVTAERVAADLDSAESLNRADMALADVRGRIAELEGSAKLRVVAIAALVGRSIADLPAFESKPLPSLAYKLPDDVTLDLISRRADITASRWRVEAAERNLDAARAAFFPDFTINVLAGLSSIDATRLLEYGSRVPQAAAAVHLPIFDAGRLKAQYGGRQAAIGAAVSSYQDAVVSAARDVATQAATREQLNSERVQRAAEVQSALELRSRAAARVRQGLIDSRTELDATESWLEQRDALLALDAAALSADIALQRALGGGYESPGKPATSSSMATTTTP